MIKTTAILLLLGTAFFWGGAFTPPFKQWSSAYREYLEIIHQYPLNWIWINGAMAIGVIFTLLGFELLSQVLVQHGSLYLGRLARSAFLFGAVLWVAYLAYRITVEPWAATETIAASAVPDIFNAFHKWMGLLFSVYMILAYLAITGFGYAMLTTALLPAWACWTGIIFGLLGVVLFPTGLLFFEPPLMIHLVPGIWGVLLVKY